jgi:hypothetical protein
MEEVQIGINRDDEGPGKEDLHEKEDSRSRVIAF